MSEHKQIQLYVGLDEGGCIDVGTINLAGFTLVSSSQLTEMRAQNEKLRTAATALLWQDTDENRQELRNTLMLTPLGCLREIEAKAIESVITDELYRIIKPKDCAIAVEDYLTDCANKIRQEPQ